MKQLEGPSQVPTLQWRLAILMAERGIRSAADLHRLLEVALTPDETPTRQQVTKWVRDRPSRLTLRVFDALCAVLWCTPTDLLQPHDWWLLGSTDETRTGAGGYQPAGILHAVAPDKIDITGRSRPLAPCGEDVIQWSGSSWSSRTGVLPACEECVRITDRHHSAWS